MTGLARYLGIVYETVPASPAVSKSRPDSTAQLRLSLSPGRARRGFWPFIIVFFAISIEQWTMEKSPAGALFGLIVVAVAAAWTFVRQSRTFLEADAYSVRIHRPFLPVKQIARQEIGMLTKEGMICDRAGHPLGTDTPWTPDQVEELRAFLDVPMVDKPSD